MGMRVDTTHATVKGHGLTVGDQVNFHGMMSDNFPASDPTLCVLGKDGNKYTLTSVEALNSVGKPWVWTFGASAQIWTSPVEKVEIIEHVSDGVTLYSGTCAHGYSTGLYADKDDAIAVAAGHGTVSIPTYVAPASEVDSVVGRWLTRDWGFTVAEVNDALSTYADIVSHGERMGSLPRYVAEKVAVAWEADRVKTIEAPEALNPIVVPGAVLTRSEGMAYQVTVSEVTPNGVVTLDGSGQAGFFQTGVLNWQIAEGIVEVGTPAMGKFASPTNAPTIDGYEWKRYVIPGDTVTALSTYQLIKAGSVCQVAATVKYVKDGRWQASGCVWMSTGLTEGFWQGESLADAFAHVVQYMTWVESVRGSGLTWSDINRLDWRVPYVAPVVPQVSVGDTVYRDRDGAQGMVRDILKSGGLKSISAPVRTKLAKRARKQGKRHAFAGGR